MIRADGGARPAGTTNEVMKRRTFLAAAVAAPAIARAQPAWPTKPIRWIMPFASGVKLD
jgi:tripartite-type tricarboxylate transporter receptor subunit TctC